LRWLTSIPQNSRDMVRLCGHGKIKDHRVVIDEPRSRRLSGKSATTSVASMGLINNAGVTGDALLVKAALEKTIGYRRALLVALNRIASNIAQRFLWQYRSRFTAPTKSTRAAGSPFHRTRDQRGIAAQRLLVPPKLACISQDARLINIKV